MPDAYQAEIHLRDFFRPHVRRLVFVVLITMFLAVLTMLPPLFIRAIIDRVITEGQRDLFFLLGFLMIATPLLASFLSYIQTVTIGYLGQRFVFDIRVRLYNHMLNMSLRFFNKHSVGKLVNRLMGDTGRVQRTLTGQSIGVVADLVSATFAITATFVLNWRMAIMVMIVVIGFVINYRMNIRKIVRASRSYRASMDRLSGGVQNRLLGNVAVKSFGTEDREQGIFREESLASMRLTTEAAVAATRFSMNSGLLQQMGRMLLYFTGCYFVLHDQMTYGDVVAFTTYTMQMLSPAVRFSELVRTFQDVRISIDRIFEIFRAKPEVSSEPGAKVMKQARGEVEFDNVYFHYDPGEPVLEGFNLHLQPGQSVALIGPTGCGKSTVLNLLMRFYDVISGSIRIDGVDLRKIELHSLRQQFGVVLQEPLLFDVSVEENIRYSRPSATKEEIKAAAQAAEIHDYITSLQHGYDTIIGGEGIEMSLGQKQRITIARAIVANPAILIMDEATSSLDSESESAIQLAMSRVLKGRTSFVVAHRLSTIRNADLIVLLKDGRIDEMGNHQQLMARPDGRYRALYEKFMGKGIMSEEEGE